MSDVDAFELQQSLAQLGVAVASARAELTNIRQQTEAYLVEREEEAQKLVDDILANSRLVLEEANRNTDLVKQYANEVQAVADEVASWREKHIEAIRKSNFEMAERLAAIATREEETSRLVQDHKTLSQTLQMQREALSLQVKANADREKQLDSREAAVNAAAKELKVNAK